VYHCQWSPGLLYIPEACFSSLSDVLECLSSLYGSGVTGQASTWLEITTQLARKLGHQIGYYL